MSSRRRILEAQTSRPIGRQAPTEVDRRRNLWLFWIFNYRWHHDYAYSRNMHTFNLRDYAYSGNMHIGNVVTMHILRICISANQLTMHITDICIFGAYWVLYSWSTVLQPEVVTNRTVMVLLPGTPGSTSVHCTPSTSTCTPEPGVTCGLVANPPGALCTRTSYLGHAYCIHAPCMHTSCTMHI